MNNEKIDWHDYVRIKRDAARDGKFILYYISTIIYLVTAITIFVN